MNESNLSSKQRSLYQQNYNYDIFNTNKALSNANMIKRFDLININKNYNSNNVFIKFGTKGKFKFDRDVTQEKNMLDQFELGGVYDKKKLSSDSYMNSTLNKVSEQINHWEKNQDKVKVANTEQEYEDKGVIVDFLNKKFLDNPYNFISLKMINRREKALMMLKKMDKDNYSINDLIASNIDKSRDVIFTKEKNAIDNDKQDKNKVLKQKRNELLTKYGRVKYFDKKVIKVDDKAELDNEFAMNLNTSLYNNENNIFTTPSKHFLSRLQTISASNDELNSDLTLIKRASTIARKNSSFKFSKDYTSFNKQINKIQGDDESTRNIRGKLPKLNLNANSNIIKNKQCEDENTYYKFNNQVILVKNSLFSEKEKKIIKDNGLVGMIPKVFQLTSENAKANLESNLVRPKIYANRRVIRLHELGKNLRSGHSYDPSDYSIKEINNEFVYTIAKKSNSKRNHHHHTHLPSTDNSSHNLSRVNKSTHKYPYASTSAINESINEVAYESKYINNTDINNQDHDINKKRSSIKDHMIQYKNKLNFSKNFSNGLKKTINSQFEKLCIISENIENEITKAKVRLIEKGLVHNDFLIDDPEN